MNILRVGVRAWANLKPECYPSRKTGCKAGVELDILDTIATIANLQISLLISNEPTCGKAPFENGSNGTWTGLLKMLINDEIDIIGNFCLDREIVVQEIFDFSWPVWQYQQQFLIQTPTTPPLSFAPFAPFSWLVWTGFAVICVLCIGLVAVNHCEHKFLKHLYEIATTFGRTDCKFASKISVKIIRPFWLVLLTSAFLFYTTYILFVVLHPLSISKPFSNTNEYLAALMSGQYRVLSFRNPPSSGICPNEQCEQRFQDAIKKHGFTYYKDKPLPIIAEQNPESESKLVLTNGMPFISLYFADYPYGRERFWIIDAGIQKWSAYLWRKNFTHARKFNRYLRNIGDYKLNALLRYARPYGGEPRTGDRIQEKTRTLMISLPHFKTLFLVHFGGMIVAAVVFLAEIGFVNRHRCIIRAS